MADGHVELGVIGALFNRRCQRERRNGQDPRQLTALWPIDHTRGAMALRCRLGHDPVPAAQQHFLSVVLVGLPRNGTRGEPHRGPQQDHTQEGDRPTFSAPTSNVRRRHLLSTGSAMWLPPGRPPKPEGNYGGGPGSRARWQSHRFIGNEGARRLAGDVTGPRCDDARSSRVPRAPWPGQQDRALTAVNRRTHLVISPLPTL
jgi:hypothetical protein